MGNRTTLERTMSLAAAALLIAALGGCDDDEGEYQLCDYAEPDCPDGTTCHRSGNAGEARCVPSCTPDESDCGDGYVCHEFGDGSTACVEPCDPEDPEACGDGLSCDLYPDGVAMCTEPVTLMGQVFDLADLIGIEGAHVVAADDTGAAASDVAITDADGNYSLVVSSARDAGGLPTEVFTLRVAAQDYLPYPHGIRPSIPIDAGEAEFIDDAYQVDSPPTHVGLILLPPGEQGQGSISGTVLPEGASGTLVVAEGGAVPAPFGFADIGGVYTIFNVPAGAYEVRGYQAGLQLAPATATVADGEALTGVDLAASEAALAVVSGQVNIVNAPGGSMTSVVLIPESTFDETSVRGEVPPGLRAPDPTLAPNVTSGFEIAGVPAGDYVVLAAFENDDLVRDPDPSIAGTQIVHISVPHPDQGTAISLAESFKITEALETISPGTENPEPVSTSPEFIWADDSSETGYAIVVYNAFGQLVWEDPELPRVTGSETVNVTYGGPALEEGMYYQWRVTSFRDTGPISTTEELRGVFFVPGTE